MVPRYCILHVVTLVILWLFVQGHYQFNISVCPTLVYDQIPEKVMTFPSTSAVSSFYSCYCERVSMPMSAFSSKHCITVPYFFLCIVFVWCEHIASEKSFLHVLPLWVLEKIKTVEGLLFLFHHTAEPAGPTANPPQIKQHIHTHARTERHTYIHTHTHTHAHTHTPSHSLQAPGLHQPVLWI